MKILSTIAAATLALTMTAPIALAQNANGSVNSASEYSPGQMKKMDGEASATQNAPGQLQTSGEVNSATEAAPGQMKKLDAETTASINPGDRNRLVKAFSANQVDPITADFDLQAGVEVPDSYTLQPLPSDAATIAPVYEGHSYLYTDDGQYVIVDPETRVVIDIIS